MVGTSTPVVVLALILLLNGAGRSIGATGYSTVIFSDVPRAEMRHANTLMITVQQLSASWGVALGAIALRVGDPIAACSAAPPGRPRRLHRRLHPGRLPGAARYRRGAAHAPELGRLPCAAIMHPQRSRSRPGADAERGPGRIELWSRSASQVSRR